MMIRIIRRLTLDEVKNKITQLEKEYDMTFDEFEELFLSRKLDRHMVGTYFEWASLVHAYRGYVEGGELDYVIEELRDLSPEETALLTPKRIELLYSLASLRAESINKLAQKNKAKREKRLPRPKSAAKPRLYYFQKAWQKKHHTRNISGGNYSLNSVSSLFCFQNSLVYCSLYI